MLLYTFQSIVEYNKKHSYVWCQYHILTSIGMLGTTTISSTSPTESSGENLNVLRWLKVIVLLSLISRFTFSQTSL